MFQAAELLRHPHLRPYVLKIHLKSNTPRRSSLAVHWPESPYTSKISFAEQEDGSPFTYREMRGSFCNNRNLNPSISEAEQDSLCSTLNQRFEELAVESTNEEPISLKAVALETPKRTLAKASATPKRRIDPSKHRDSVGSFIPQLLHYDRSHFCNTCRFLLIIYIYELGETCPVRVLNEERIKFSPNFEGLTCNKSLRK